MESKKTNLDDILSFEYEGQKEATEDALLEYIGNLEEIDSKKKVSLEKKLNSDEKYKHNFALSIMQMSLLISASMVVSNDVEFNRIKKKVLFEARQDDKLVYEMRMFYLNNITAEELSEILVEEEEKEIFTKRIGEFKSDYMETKDFS